MAGTSPSSARSVWAPKQGPTKETRRWTYRLAPLGHDHADRLVDAVLRALNAGCGD
ncbi:hypothetical protein ACWCXH_32570 [Kitasatospora sp. NPDC001660]